MTKKKAIILLSGGLDSLVSLGLSKSSDNVKYSLKLALTFDYGQKSAEYEIAASRKICEYYNIEHNFLNIFPYFCQRFMGSTPMRLVAIMASIT